MGWLDKCKNEAMSLTKEKRQEFMDYMREGKTIGEASEKSGISSDAGVYILKMNIKSCNYISWDTD